MLIVVLKPEEERWKEKEMNHITTAAHFNKDINYLTAVRVILNNNTVPMTWILMYCATCMICLTSAQGQVTDFASVGIQI